MAAGRRAWNIHIAQPAGRELEPTAAMIRGNIAIPDKDPKTWRSRGRRRKPSVPVPTIIEGVKSPEQIKRDQRIKRLRALTEG